MEKEETYTPRPPLTTIQGFPFVKCFADNWAKVESFQARPDDLLICTYPKAGIELLVNTPPPRVIKTHLPVKLLPKTLWKNNCKIIYVARNAKDVAVSFYYFTKIAVAHPEYKTWDEFLESYMAGKSCVVACLLRGIQDGTGNRRTKRPVAYGSWFDHVKGWWEKRKDHRILYLFYEDMKEDPKREIQKVMQFMEMELGEEILERIVQHTTFKEMSDNLMTNRKSTPPSWLDQKTYTFMRKGITGDWKNHFTVAQSERFDEEYERNMTGTSLHFIF